MLTCLCDALYGEVGIAAVQVLEHCGVEVIFPENQTCCGQPAFNSGDWQTASQLVNRLDQVFDPNLPIVVPSASCAAMLRHGRKLLKERFPQSAGDSLHAPVFELSEYLLNELGLDRWPIRGSSISTPKKVAFHRSCHSRAIGLNDSAERLLSLVSRLEIVPFAEQEQCCGFGGAFSASQPTLSASIGKQKLMNFVESGITQVLSGDMGCLMHLSSLATKEQIPLEFRHYVQVLAGELS